MDSATPARKTRWNESEAGRCRLLELPMELQLAIYELAVLESGPLLLNMPCNSSFRRGRIFMMLERIAWDSGTKHPPTQPAITRTCRAIRAETLPLFYGENVFRACYCSPESMLPKVIAWLRMIGPQNREMLRHFYLYDRNEDQDIDYLEYGGEDALTEAKRCGIFTELLGRMETMNGRDCCCHHVAFGDWTRKNGEVPLGLEPGVPRLRSEDEICELGMV